MINVTNSIYIPGKSEDLPPPSSHTNTTCRQPDTHACTSVPHLYSVHSDMPGKVRKPCPESVPLSLPSFSRAITMSDPTPAQVCSATAQQSDSGREVQKLSQCQILDCQGLCHVITLRLGSTPPLNVGACQSNYTCLGHLSDSLAPTCQPNGNSS